MCIEGNYSIKAIYSRNISSEGEGEGEGEEKALKLIKQLNGKKAGISQVPFQTQH